jgi:cytochrome c oxidase subunit IV
MSAPAAATHAVESPDHGDSKFQIFVQIAMILAVITGVEIVLVYIPLARWFIMTVLIILSAVKFMMVIFYFMHLRWDKLFCTIVFFIGLILAGGTVLALLALFASHDSFPLDAGAPPNF